MKNIGTLVISLDFELIWGVFDKVDYNEKKLYFKNTLKVIPKILQLFEDYNISCTWAIVGMLFNENWEEWNSNISTEIPRYSNDELSAYKYGKTIIPKEIEFMCFAKDLIKEISSSPNQEIGSHTYSHYYCLEDGQNIDSFRADLESAITIAGTMGIELKSLVFPRNQLNEHYLKICYDLGITSVRSNPKSWYWKDTEKNKLLNKVFRTGDAYIGINDKSYDLKDIKTNKSQPILQPASRLLRPFTGNKLINKLKLKRIKSEMLFAARNNEIYHLWWHPHNFGNNPEQNLIDLKDLLEHFKKCKQDFGFQSLNMNELSSQLLQNK